MNVPWQLKMGGKIFLSRIPLPHRFWNKIGIFRHGRMQEFEYAHEVFVNHLRLADLEDVRGNACKVLLELGPGESLFSAMLARAYGFRGSILVDIGNFALVDLSTFREFGRWLHHRGLDLPDLAGCATIADVLPRLNFEYLTDGLRSLKNLPDRSVDFIFSQAVLEHVRRSEFVETVREIRRILMPGGISTHVVDLRDHLQNSLNNLRFSEAFWESNLVSSSGFYTNRLRYQELLEIFSTVGFKVEVVTKTEWGSLPVPRKVLDPQFRSIPEDLLRISGLTLRLQ